MRTITPHRVKCLRRAARESRIAYVTARRAALSAKAAGAGRIAREDALCVVLDARFWAREYERRLAGALASGIVKGSAMSPAAQARAIASGRLKL